jgi:hypothetical protein
MKLKQLLFGIGALSLTNNALANNTFFKNTDLLPTTYQFVQDESNSKCINTENIFLVTKACSNDKYELFEGKFNFSITEPKSSLNKFKTKRVRHYSSEFTPKSGAKYSRMKIRGILKEETANLFYQLETLPFGLEFTLEKWKIYGLNNGRDSFKEEGIKIGPAWKIDDHTEFKINHHRYSHELEDTNKNWNSELHMELSYRRYF